MTKTWNPLDFEWNSWTFLFSVCFVASTAWLHHKTHTKEIYLAWIRHGFADTDQVGLIIAPSRNPSNSITPTFTLQSTYLSNILINHTTRHVSRFYGSIPTMSFCPMIKSVRRSAAWLASIPLSTTCARRSVYTGQFSELEACPVCREPHYDPILLQKSCGPLMGKEEWNEVSYNLCVMNKRVGSEPQCLVPRSLLRIHSLITMLGQMRPKSIS